MSTMPQEATPIAPAERQASELLELFYPVHYRGNMALEDAMRGELTRKQAAIMWLIRSEGGSSHGMRRKDIFRKLGDLFDITNPAVTKALRGMMRPPLGLVRLAESPDSAREKTVFLTSKGERFLETMVARGHEFMCQIVLEMRQQLGEDEVDYGIRFLRAGVAGYERIDARSTKPGGNQPRRRADGAVPLGRTSGRPLLR
jgi:DNA-binding MarR family transcriptional regulator